MPRSSVVCRLPCVGCTYSLLTLNDTDLLDLENLAPITFTLDAPLRPFEQLLAVLPIRSAKHLPASFLRLMTNPASVCPSPSEITTRSLPRHSRVLAAAPE